MKHLIAAACFLAAGSATAWAQVPEKLAFQGKLTNATGTPVNGNVTLRFRLYDGPAGGATLLYDESQTGVPVANGLYAVYIGDGTPNAPSPVLSTLSFNAAYWLSVEVNGDGEMTPRYRLSSSPYAVRSQISNGLEGMTATSAQLNLLVGGGNADALHVHDWSAITGKPSLAVLNQSNVFNQTNMFSVSQSFTVATGTAPFVVASSTKVANLNADLLDGLNASAFALTGHDHVGQSWTAGLSVVLGLANTSDNAITLDVGSTGNGPTYGVRSIISSPNGTGVSGRSTATTGGGIGVSGQAASASGFGVAGSNSNGIGVFGFTSANTAAVFGQANGAGASVGVQGQTSGTTGMGIQGNATASSGVTYGVYGQTSSPAGFGLYTPNAAFVGGNLQVGGSVSGTFSGTLADGIVTAPKIATLPKVKVMSSTSLAVANNTFVTLPFDTNSYDTSSFHSTVTNPTRLTVSTPGYYRVTANLGTLGYSAASGFVQIQLLRNGGSLASSTGTIHPQISSFGMRLCVSTTDSFAAGDYIELDIIQVNSSSVGVTVQGGGNGGVALMMEYVP